MEAVERQIYGILLPSTALGCDQQAVSRDAAKSPNAIIARSLRLSRKSSKRILHWHDQRSCQAKNARKFAKASGYARSLRRERKLLLTGFAEALMSGEIEIYYVPLVTAMICFGLLWPISVLRADVSIVDLAWGPGFLVQFLVAMRVQDTISVHGWLLLAAIAAWSIRLGFVIARRRWREGHEDPRYQTLRRSWGAAFWWKSLFVVFLLQAFVQWLVVTGPISGLSGQAQTVSAIGWLGILVSVLGLGLESVADNQLDRFKQAAKPGSLMTTGLRGIVRHPNYTGEMIFWIGIALVVIDSGSWFGVISPALICLFLTKVSGSPMLDERLSETRPGYGAYKASVPAFFPSFSRQRGTQTD
jgi:steroid 5-alpha reductase family enzyme